MIKGAGLAPTTERNSSPRAPIAPSVPSVPQVPLVPDAFFNGLETRLRLQQEEQLERQRRYALMPIVLQRPSTSEVLATRPPGVSLNPNMR